MYKPELVAKLIEDLGGANADAMDLLDRFLEKSRPPAVNTLLRRCALARCFDEELYTVVLSKGVEPPIQFAKFLEQPDVQVTPRAGKPVCAIKSPLRERYREQWKSDPAAIGWHREIAKFEADRKPPDQLNVLYHQVQSDKELALQTFYAAFSAAEDKFDLAQCYSLLSILDELQLELGLELTAARERKQQIYRSRAFFADAYYRTSTFYARRGALKAFNQLRRSKDKRIFHIHATGGMGKTMFLRWLMARNLIPQRVPCAWVDFDRILHANMLRYPQLLLLPLARQLNVQLPQTFFTELLGKLQAYEHWVVAPAPGTKPAASSANPEQEMWSSHLTNFISAIRYDSGIKDVVLLFDTLEVVTLQENEFLPIYYFLEQLLEAPQVSVILSGRFDISRKIPERKKDFEDRSACYHMSRFTEPESKGYLKSRKLGDDMVKEMVKKVLEPREAAEKPGCSPFKLSLFAELVLDREIKVEEVRRLPNADLAYLLERVILRIPEQPLRWVVRYGALPRKLTEDYITRVLLEPLKDALRQASTEDQPRAFGLEDFGPGGEQDYWKHEPEADPKASDLWTALCRYETDRGWISRSSSDQSTVQFHPDVTDPMRDLLARQKIFGNLQERSIRYFEDLAEAEKHRWGEWICEAIFHKFQLDGPAAIPYWELKLDHERTIANPAFRRQVAAEILRREYAEEERTPRRRMSPAKEGETQVEQGMVTPAALAKAHCETARAILNTPGFTVDNPVDWAELKRHMTIAGELQTELGITVIDPVQAARFQAASRVQMGQHMKAVPILESELTLATAPSDRFWLEYDLAQVGTNLEDPAIVKHTHAAIQLLPVAKAPGVKSSDLRIALATWFTSEGQFQAAYDEYHQALQETGEDTQAATDLQGHLAWAALKAGDYENAYTLVDDLKRRNLQTTPALHRLEAWLYRAVKDPVAAMTVARTAQSLAHGTDENAYCYDLLGLIRGDQMQFSRSFDEWEEALKLFSRKTPQAAESTMIDQVALQAQAMGNFKEALLTAESAARLPAMNNPELEARLRVEVLLAQARMGDQDAATKTAEKLLRHNWTSVLLARVLATILASEPAQGEDLYLDDLCATLARIEPPTVRLELLEALHFRERPFGNAESRRAQFLALLPALSEGSLGFAARALVVAEVHRLLGSTAAARELLRKALTILVAHGSLQAAIRAMETLRSLGDSADWPEPPADLQEHEFARGAMLLVRAEARIDAGILTGLEEVLNRAEKLLATDSYPTRWHARLCELRAKLAFARGHQANEGARQSLRAVDAYQTLRDRRSVERVKRIVRRAYVVQSGDAMLAGETPRSSPETSVSRIVITPIRPAELASRDLEGWGKLLTSPSAPDQIAKALLDASPRYIQHSPADLALSLSSGLDSAAPWEWGAPPSVRYLYRMRPDSKEVPAEVATWVQSTMVKAGIPVRVDGIFGPATAAAFGGFTRRFHIPSQAPDGETMHRIRAVISQPGWEKGARLLLVQPRVSQLDAGEAGYASRAGTGAMELYGNWGGAVNLLNEPLPNEFGDAVVKLRPHAIHFVCSLQASNGVAQLAFTRERAGNWEPITAHLLSRMLRQLPPTVLRPFLVLDVARPYSTWEAAYTLCLRNQFASDLMHLEAFSGVLATGLAQPRQLERLGGTISGQLMHNASMGETWRAIQTLQPVRGSFDDLLAFASPALFCMEPELPCLSLSE